MPISPIWLEISNILGQNHNTRGRSAEVALKLKNPEHLQIHHPPEEARAEDALKSPGGTGLWKHWPPQRPPGSAVEAFSPYPQGAPFGVYNRGGALPTQQLWSWETQGRCHYGGSTILSAHALYSGCLCRVRRRSPLRCIVSLGTTTMWSRSTMAFVLISLCGKSRKKNTNEQRKERDMRTRWTWNEG